jgi:peptidoglycan hydrolase CwlO-like protein
MEADTKKEKTLDELGGKVEKISQEVEQKDKEVEKKKGWIKKLETRL